jgi:pyridoxamine--pyruvate transaminase
MPTSTLHALRVAAGIVLEDRDGFLRRHAETASLVREGLRELGFRLYVEDERYTSPVVTAAYAHETMDLGDYMGWLASVCRMRIARGIDTGEAPVFRVGHMGLAADPEVAAAYLELTRRYLAERAST